MPATLGNLDTLIRENIVQAVRHVFQTMLENMPVTIVETESPAATGAPFHGIAHVKPHIVGNVGFTGKTNGLVYIHFPLPLAELCTCTLLAMTPAELAAGGEETVNDAIGEFTNMIAGSFKNGFCDVGCPCTLTMPSILRGSDLSIQPVRSSMRRTHTFECAGHRIIVEVHLKMDE